MLMRFFLPLFTGLLALAHVYMFLSLRRAFRPGAWQYFAAVFLALAFGSFFLRRFLAPRTFDTALTHVAYSWLGLLLVVCVFLAARDAAWLAAELADRLTGTSLRGLVSGERSMRIAFVAGLLAFAWSLREANDIRTTVVTIETDRLPANVERLRVAALSDMHINAGTPVAVIDRVVELVNRQEADIVAGLGDFIDGRFAPDGPQAVALGRLRAKSGKFAVIGNHEIYSGLSGAVAFLEGSGFTLLRGTTAEAGGIVVAGVDDPQVGSRTGIVDVLDGVAPDRFVLLLSHRPEVPPEAPGMFDLELSGHTHGGQIWPAGLLVRLVHGFGQGLTEISAPEGKPRARSLLHVSNGVRHWGPPVRFLTPPEIIVIDLVRKGGADGK